MLMNVDKLLGAGGAVHPCEGWLRLVQISPFHVVVLAFDRHERRFVVACAICVIHFLTTTLCDRLKACQLVSVR